MKKPTRKTNRNLPEPQKSSAAQFLTYVASTGTFDEKKNEPGEPGSKDESCGI